MITVFFKFGIWLPHLIKFSFTLSLSTFIPFSLIPSGLNFTFVALSMAHKNYVFLFPLSENLALGRVVRLLLKFSLFLITSWASRNG